MNTNKNILITGSRAPVALDLTRTLRKDGYNVFCADSIKHPLCRFSKDRVRSFRVAAPRQNPEEYISDLIAICKKHQIGLIIPTCEEVFYLSKYKDKFSGIAEVFVDSYLKMKSLHSKWDFITLVQAMGLEAPHSQLIDNPSTLEGIIQRPLILKPVYSRFGSRVYFLKQGESLPPISPSPQEPWIAQEYLEGRVWCSYSVVHEGRLALHTNYSSDFKAGQGASIHFEHVYVAAIENWVKAFVAKIQFTGQIAFDFIETKEGKFIPIECNPRSTSGIHLLSPLTKFSKSFIAGNGDTLQPFSTSTATLKLPMWVYGLSSIKSFGQLKKWFKAMQAKDVIFRFKDPLPSLHQFFTFFEFWLRGKKLKMDPIQASTYDIEYNGDL